jgi:hypothetical protein
MIRLALAALLALVSSTSALAMSDGVPGASGSTDTFRCTNCHQTPGAPAVSVVGLDDVVLRPGDSVRLDLVVQSALAGPRETGFTMSSTAATLSSADPDVLRPNLHELTHGAPRASDGAGRTQWSFDLSDIVEGRHRLFIGVNDADGNGRTSNDRAVHIVVPLVVCDREDVDSDGDGFADGCDTCPGVADPEQQDTDGDFIGDACDVCPDVPDPDQADLDRDGLGDACDADTDDCAAGADTCSEHADCEDRPFRDFVCTCRAGFVGNGFSCDNVDECAAGSDDCDTLARCDDTVGSFTCTCPTGYAGTGTTADPCVDIDECAAGSDDCDANATCRNTAGAFECTCQAGFTGTGQVCTDIDECADAPCGDHATCDNSDGAFACVCDDGYEDRGAGCVDIDECATGTAACDGRCENSDGAFVCHPADDDDDDDDDDGGCAQPGGMPLGLALLAVLRRRLR